MKRLTLKATSSASHGHVTWHVVMRRMTTWTMRQYAAEVCKSRYKHSYTNMNSPTTYMYKKLVEQLHKETEDRWDEMVGSANGAPVGEATNPQCEMQRCS